MDYLTMNDHSNRLHHDNYNKSRSKSICSPQSLRIETVISPPDYEFTDHELSSMGYQRSKSPGPGRSQSPYEPGVSLLN